LPKRLAERWLEHHDLTDLKQWRMKPAGTEGYAKAEVTAGGVHPDELSSKSMESRKIPACTSSVRWSTSRGHLGGYNFQWAWSSGWAGWTSGLSYGIWTATKPLAILHEFTKSESLRKHAWR
jgi:predicted flavoprotein YhiN